METKNFQLAHQLNLIKAFSALFLLESVFLDYIQGKNSKQFEIKSSKLI